MSTIFQESNLRLLSMGKSFTYEKEQQQTLKRLSFLLFLYLNFTFISLPPIT